MGIADLQVFSKILFCSRPAVDAQEIDNLNEKSRLAIACLPHGLDQLLQTGDKPVVADPQQGAARDVANAGCLDDNHTGLARARCVRTTASTSSVTSPSSVARHGTIAGTQVRCSSLLEPISMGLNSSEAAASSIDGQTPGSGSYLILSSGRHIRFFNKLHVAKSDKRLSAASE